MKKDVDLVHIAHCDYEGCDMGQLELTCPLCEGTITTCDNWYEVTDYGNMPEKIDFNCDHCNKIFTVHYEEYEWFYKGDKDGSRD